MIFRTSLPNSQTITAWKLKVNGHGIEEIPASNWDYAKSPETPSVFQIEATPNTWLSGLTVS